MESPKPPRRRLTNNTAAWCFTFSASSQNLENVLEMREHSPRLAHLSIEGRLKPAGRSLEATHFHDASQIMFLDRSMSERQKSQTKWFAPAANRFAALSVRNLPGDRLFATAEQSGSPDLRGERGLYSLRT